MSKLPGSPGSAAASLLSNLPARDREYGEHGGKDPKSEWRLRMSPWICGVITLLVNLGHRLMNIPLNRLFEINLCREYWSHHDPSLVGSDGRTDELFCKEDPIQEKLAFYIGLITTLELICGPNKSIV